MSGLPGLPVLAQHRNATTKHSSTAVITHRICGRENPRTACHAPSATTIRPSAIAVGAAGMAMSGSSMASEPVRSPKSASPGFAPSPHAKMQISPATMIAPPAISRVRSGTPTSTTCRTTTSSSSAW